MDSDSLFQHFRSNVEVVIVEKDKSVYSPDRLLGDVRTGDTDGVREDEYGLCLSLSIVEAEPTKWYCE